MITSQIFIYAGKGANITAKNRYVLVVSLDKKIVNKLAHLAGRVGNRFYNCSLVRHTE